MQNLILIFSAIALTSAQYHNYYQKTIYPQHIPVIGHNGVPVDTPEVQAARASHLAALSAASHGHQASHYTAPWAYNTHGNSYNHFAVPVIAPDGTPIDTPDVQLAKNAHFAAYNEAAARNGVSHGPIDTPEVQQAKAAHFAAHAQLAHHGRYRRALFYSYPEIGHDGSPIETPEVQAAKAHHFAAHAEALYRHSAAPLDNTHARYAAHVPILTSNGVPQDTPEVQHAKAEHFAAHAEAATRSHYGVVVPVDTPDVQLAKLQHFAAHEAAHSYHY